MLQSIREKSTSKFFYLTLLILMSGGLVFFGIGDYNFGGAQTFVAKVGDQVISEQDFQTRLDQQRSRMRAMMGESYNARMFENVEFKRQLLDQLIDEALLSQAGVEAGLSISDDKIREEIDKQEMFQVDGKFDKDRYLQLLQSNNLSAKQYDEILRKDMAVRELPSQIVATALVTNKELDAFVKLRDQARDFRYVTVPASPVVATDIAEAEVKKYFDSHPQDFASPEQVMVEYVELNGASLASGIVADEKVLLDRYQEQLSRFGTKEQRLTSHLLVEVASDADAEAQKTAQKRAEGFAAEILAGKTFADIAMNSSDDVGSKEAGGDLGWIEQGTVEPAFEQALFALKPGEISAPVRTDQGYHLIYLREVIPAAIKSFEEVRAQLESEFIEEQRSEKFTDLQDKLFEAAEQSSETLDLVAKAIGNSVQKSQWFSKDSGSGIAATPEIREAAFSPEVKEDGLSSEPIQLSKDRMVVLRLAEHKASAPKKYDEVKEQIRLQLARETSEKNNRQAAESMLKRLLGNESLDAIANTLGANVVEAKMVGRQGSEHDGVLVSEVFKMARPAPGTVTNGLAEIAGKNYALVQLQAVHEGDASKLDDAARTAARDQLKQELSSFEADAFRKSLRERIPVQINEDRL